MRAARFALALAALPVPSARADEAARAPFQVEFSAGLNCRTEDFSAELLRRSQHVRPAGPGEQGFVFQIDIRDNEGTLEGRLTLREPHGRVTVRVVPGATCSEIIPALAVIAAVLVEPSAAVEPSPSQPVTPIEPPERNTGWGVGASVGLVAQGAVAPEVRAGFGIEASGFFDSGGVLSPLFALAYVQTRMGTAPTPSSTGTAELRWWTVRASTCPVRWPATGPAALRPCALFDLGALKGTGTRTDIREEVTMTWVAPGFSARLDAAPLDWLWLIAEGGVFVPLNRDRFIFDPPPEEAYQPPDVGGMARLAVGGRFQ
jgi:hypothetical protein